MERRGAPNVNGLVAVGVPRKATRNVHVGGFTLPGRKGGVPDSEWMDDEAIRLAVVSYLAGIRREQRAFQAQIQEWAREMPSSNSHYFRVERFPLDVVEKLGRSNIELAGNTG